MGYTNFTIVPVIWLLAFVLHFHTISTNKTSQIISLLAFFGLLLSFLCLLMDSSNGIRRCGYNTTSCQVSFNPILSRIINSLSCYLALLKSTTIIILEFFISYVDDTFFEWMEVTFCHLTKKKISFLSKKWVRN